MSQRILIVEDDHELRQLVGEILGGAGYETRAFPSADDAWAALAGGAPADLVVTDLVMRGMSGEELVRAVRRARPELNVVVITAFGSIESAIELVRAGAFDYVTKPFPTGELLRAVERGLEDSRIRRHVATLSRAAPGGQTGFIGGSAVMREVFQLITRAGGTRHPVLIAGESGTGKELVARAVHAVSGRDAFVIVNCGALPEHLLESELFGHEKGAFTGADRPKPGLLETAHGGTLFLDEIGELPLSLQPKLLRVLEQGEVRRVGANTTRTLDVRVIAATNRRLDAEARAGRFREDLYWRLNVVLITVPPLRDRRSDIPLLVEHLLESVRLEQPAAPRRLTPRALGALMAYHWPGNVRELRNAIQRACVLAEGDEVDVGDLPAAILDAATPGRQSGGDPMSLDAVERNHILEVLRKTGGNKSRAAEILGMDRKTLYRKLERIEGEPPPEPT